MLLQDHPLVSYYEWSEVGRWLLLLGWFFFGCFCDNRDLNLEILGYYLWTTTPGHFISGLVGLFYCDYIRNNIRTIYYTHQMTSCLVGLSKAIMASFPDYYDILHVSKDASTEDIRQAYRRESLKLVYVTPLDRRLVPHTFQDTPGQAIQRIGDRETSCYREVSGQCSHSSIQTFK
jgi:DnaJ domain